MSPLFLVNWHKVHVRFRALMWLIAIGLAVVILLATADGSHPGRATSARPPNPHVVAGTIRPSQ
jgi:hypothetical protein